ncbi:uncharacterized protein TrAFT101_004538 [Trichoderma asperellum]|uniref:uncharacterized protein n=1 Tax=Trichoderma asperellum TaxID=101201 RepID=UPI003319B5E0|nr:hypothetical protein TrAFT101_004538 [Trichoderma asperellum]
MKCMPNPALIMDHYEDREIRTLSRQWIRDDHRVIFSLSGSWVPKIRLIHTTRIPYLQDFSMALAKYVRMQPDLSSRSLLGLFSQAPLTPPRLSFLLTPAVTPTSIGAVCRLGADEIPAHANYCCRCCCCCCCCSYGGYELGSATNTYY